jgi:hypothetical protein
MASGSLEQIFGVILAPVAWVMGVPWKDASAIGNLLGTRLVLNEFVAFLKLGPMKESLDPRSFIIATYALCGFANFSSIAIQIGGIGALAPSRKVGSGAPWTACRRGGFDGQFHVSLHRWNAPVTQAARDFIESRTELQPLTAVVLGSGLGAFADELTERTEIPYSEIPGWPVSTAVGHAGKLILGNLGSQPWP